MKYIPSGAPQIFHKIDLWLCYTDVKIEGSSKSPKKVSYKNSTVSQPRLLSRRSHTLGLALQTSPNSRDSCRFGKHIGYPKETCSALGNLQISSAVWRSEYMLQCVSSFPLHTFMIDIPIPMIRMIKESCTCWCIYIYIHTHISYNPVNNGIFTFTAFTYQNIMNWWKISSINSFMLHPFPLKACNRFSSSCGDSQRTAGSNAVVIQYGLTVYSKTLKNTVFFFHIFSCTYIKIFKKL